MRYKRDAFEWMADILLGVVFVALGLLGLGAVTLFLFSVWETITK